MRCGPPHSTLRALGRNRNRRLVTCGLALASGWLPRCVAALACKALAMSELEDEATLSAAQIAPATEPPIEAHTPAATDVVPQPPDPAMPTDAPGQPPQPLAPAAPIYAPVAGAPAPVGAPIPPPDAAMNPTAPAPVPMNLPAPAGAPLYPPPQPPGPAAPMYAPAPAGASMPPPQPPGPSAPAGAPIRPARAARSR